MVEVVALISVVSVVLVVLRVATTDRLMDVAVARLARVVVCDSCVSLNNAVFACPLTALY